MMDRSHAILEALQVHPLAPKERETLQWMALGKTYNDVAELMGISFGTVKSHLDTARYKLKAANVTQAVAIAVHLGIISMEESYGKKVDTARSEEDGGERNSWKPESLPWYKREGDNSN
jgi:DNA-binding CsgD family transcriptional regulator